ncbi:hypothetical protein JCM30237_09380 [Halolamina litorea]|uniref:Uncharacterized protein n=1 Tax=Halolamina litorea TaxID=1515593 RepID=A0ABD6BWQ7_9EURY|nr:hypothetical protein [Halolamina litorea]
MSNGAVSFSLADGVLTVRDEAGGGELSLEVDEGASTTPATGAWFDVPVDGAVSLETTAIEMRNATSAQLRSDDGEHYGSVDGAFELSGGVYADVSAAVKLLVYVEEGPIEGRLVGDPNNPDSLLLTFEEPTRVVVGARSFHETPVATMTIRDDPADLMTAVSHLGSSIKEWSAERSWPTLRGHPPGIEVGDERHIPDGLSIPDTEVTVGVPLDVADVLRVAPLAHYFGAEVVPADRAELRLGSQHVEALGSGAELEQSVDDLLAHALVLDSLVRIGGYYSLPRYEYEELAPELPFYPPELYDEPVHRQLLEYLEVSVDTVAPYAPDWPAVGTLHPTIDDAETLPYLLNTLSRVHVTEDATPRDPATLHKPIDISTNLSPPPHVAAFPPAARERATGHEEQAAGDASVLFVGWDRPEPDSFARADWGRFRLEGVPTATYRRSVTRTELRSLLAEPYAYVHYGNRVSADGFVCSDGVLAFDDLPDGTAGAISFQWDRPTVAPLTGLFDTVSVACLSAESLRYDTTRALAAYLMVGRSVASSARLAGADETRFVGDPTLSVTRRPIGHCPPIFHVERSGADEYQLSVELDTDEHDPLGRVMWARFENGPDGHRLAGTHDRLGHPLSAAELEHLLDSDGIFRFGWGPTSNGLPDPPILKDYLPE